MLVLIIDDMVFLLILLLIGGAAPETLVWPDVLGPIKPLLLLVTEAVCKSL
jgi:hypothetical protein